MEKWLEWLAAKLAPQAAAPRNRLVRRKGRG